MEKLIKLFEELFNKIDPEGSVLTESYKEGILGSIKESIQVYTDDQVSSATEELETTLKEGFEKSQNDAAEKLEEATSKLSQVVENAKAEAIDELDEQYAEKLEEALGSIIAKVTQLKENYSIDTDSLGEALELYIETYLETTQPEQVVVDSAKLEKLEGMVESLKQLFFKEGEFEALVTESNKNKCDDYDNVVEANIKLKAKLNALEGKILLDEKVQDLKPATAEFVIEKLTGKSADDVEAKFDETVEEFDRLEQEKIDEAKHKSKKTKVDTSLEDNNKKIDENKLSTDVANQYLQFFKKK